MKQKKLIMLLCLMACMVTTIIPASARASYQIDNYYMDCFSNNGQIYVDFSVTGTDTMKLIGCESIYVYENSAGQWLDAGSLLENDPGMSESNARKHSNMVDLDCMAGVGYKVIVTIFAEDSDGRDAREQTFYVIGSA